MNDEAGLLFKRSLIIAENVLGHDHPDVALWQANLGKVLGEKVRD